MGALRKDRMQMPRFVIPLVAVAVIITMSGCRQDMHNQPKFRGFRGSTFFADGRSVRPVIAGTVARGFLKDDTLLYTGKNGTEFSTEFPFEVTRATIERGRQRFNIYCSPCHDQVGTGRGMIVQRGYKQPPSFHDARLVSSPAGYFFDVISNGFATMPDYAAQVDVKDRWAIVSYIRALQLSQHAPLADVPAADRAKLADAK